jgi:hypothetical protein
MYVYIYGVSVKKNEKQKFASYFIIMLPIKKKKLSYFGTKSWDFRHTHLTIAGWIIYISLDFF